MRIYLRSHYGNAVKVEKKSSAEYHYTSLQVLETGNLVSVLLEWDAQRWERLQKWPKTSTIGTPYPKVSMLKLFFNKFKINCVFYRENSKIAPPKCWFLNWTFSLKKLYRHVYRTIIHISAKYENPKMHRNGGHHCPTYRLDTFIHYLRPSTLTTTLMDMLSPNNLGGAFLLIVWHLHSFPQTH